MCFKKVEQLGLEIMHIWDGLIRYTMILVLGYHFLFMVCIFIWIDS